MKSNVINCYPLKSQISILFGPPPSPGGLLLSTKMGSLDIGPLYSTLCPNITSTRFLNTFQDNAVRLGEITYTKDYILN